MNSEDWSLKRVSQPGETSWNCVVKRFIRELTKRKCKTSKEDLEWLLLNYYALPNSPALVSAGTEMFSASACSSFPIYDTLNGHPFSIMNSLGMGVRSLKAGVGTGWNFSHIRSKHENVAGRYNVAAGPVGFLKSYDGFVNEITSLTRHAACMGLLETRNPDVEDFIDAKKKDGQIRNFNISIVADDEFMKAAINDEPYTQYYQNSQDIREVSAKKIFDKAIYNMWDNGEPGIMFEDSIARDYFHPPKEHEKMKLLANPCSEAILSWGYDENNEANNWVELCVLATINVPRYANLNKEEQRRVVHTTVSMLNDIIDTQDYISEYHKRGMQEKNRKIGLGVAGLATEMAKRRIKYSSGVGYEFTRDLFREITRHAVEKSSDMGEVNGLGRYNSSIMSQAPTSTLARVFDAVNEEGSSYGLEPYFSIGEDIITTNSKGVFKNREKIEKFLKNDIKHIETANELSWKDHVNIVKAYYDNPVKGVVMGCSKTINFRNNITTEEMKEAIIYCWRNKIKALSVYRDGSRQNQVLSTESSYEENKNKDKICPVCGSENLSYKTGCLSCNDCGWSKCSL